MNQKIFLFPELTKNLPPEVKKLFAIFGAEIRLVGGCVRDLILEKKVSDYDFATRFLPQEITKILEKNKIKAVPTGAKFGTITAVLNGKNFEITTLRKDLETDGRHCEPEFVGDFFLDAARRDFTINALYLDAIGIVSDYFDGISDLKKQKVRFIGDANLRIEEDFLRILRFFRFSCDYAAKPDAQGLAACVAQKKNLKKLSRERIRQEFLKLISSEKKENLIAILKLLKSKKIAEEIFTEEMDVEAFQRLFELEEDGPRNKCGVTNCSDVATIFLGVTPPSDGVHELEQKLKLAVLFLQKNSDLKIFAKEICATNSEKKYFQFLLTVPQKLDLPSLKQLLTSHDKKLVLDFYCFCCVKKNQQFSAKILQFIRDFSAINFPLNGEDVMRLGFTGVAVGEAIGAAKKFWAENDFYPNKITLINFLKKRGG